MGGGRIPLAVPGRSNPDVEDVKLGVFARGGSLLAPGVGERSCRPVTPPRERGVEGGSNPAFPDADGFLLVGDSGRGKLGRPVDRKPFSPGVLPAPEESVRCGLDSAGGGRKPVGVRGGIELDESLLLALPIGTNIPDCGIDV